MKSVQSQFGTLTLAAVAAIFFSMTGATSARAETTSSPADSAPVIRDQQLQDAYLTVESEEVEVTRDPVKPMCELPEPSGIQAEGQGSGWAFPDLGVANVAIDQIVNLGRKIWAVFEANRPVVALQTNTANALPDGVTGWQSLQGWHMPVSRIVSVKYKNLLGMPVVNFSARILFTPGGSYDGKGKYLTQVTVVPANLQVQAGYTFNMNATIPTVLNAGTKADPIGAAEILLKWNVRTVMSHIDQSGSYYVRGDGKFVDLSNGTK